MPERYELDMEQYTIWNANGGIRPLDGYKEINTMPDQVA